MKNNIKRVATAGLAGFVLGTTLTVSAGTWIQAYRNDEIKITLNGEVQTFRDATTNEIEVPITYNDRTYLPLRSLATLVGLNVDYDANSKTAILETKDYEKELIEKYKLSDSYILNGTDVKNINFNILDSSYNMETGKYESVVANQEIISDGVKFNVECTKIGTDKMEYSMREYDVYELKINGEILELNFGSSLVKVGEVPGVSVGFIDIDPSDEYKEIVVSAFPGQDGSDYIYQLTNEGLKLLYECGNTLEYGLISVNNRYIIPNRADMVSENLVMGYYTYEDGEFKYIDRFLTGEKIKDENGNYTENFKKQVFTAQSEGSIYCPSYYNGNIVNIDGKVKFLKQNVYKDRYIYDVELMEDIGTYLNGEYITLPKGTKLIYDK